MGNYGARVSKRGYSVYDPAHKQVMDSNFPLLKIAKQGSGTLSHTANGGAVSVTIDHNLGYIPIVFVYGKHLNEDGTTVNRYVVYPYWETYGLHLWEFYDVDVTTTQLTITYTPGFLFDKNTSVDYFYYICYDKAQ